MLLLKDFEEAGEDRSVSPRQFFGQVLKLLGGNPLGAGDICLPCPA